MGDDTAFVPGHGQPGKDREHGHHAHIGPEVRVSAIPPDQASLVVVRPDKAKEDKQPRRVDNDTWSDRLG